MQEDAACFLWLIAEKKTAMKKKDKETKTEAISKIKKMFDGFSIEDKVKVIDSLASPIRRKIDKVICDTYDPDFSGCSDFFIEDTYLYYHSPTDYKSEKCMTACSYDQDNISIPLRWLDKGYDYKAEYKKICDDEETRDKKRKEFEELDMLRRLKAKYEPDDAEVIEDDEL